MPKTVTSSEARDQFGGLLKWTQENQDEVVVKLRGEPAAVIMSYDAYEEVTQLRRLQKRQQAWQKLQAIRQRVQQRVKDEDLSAEEAYLLSGFDEEAAQNLIEQDRQLAESEP